MGFSRGLNIGNIYFFADFSLTLFRINQMRKREKQKDKNRKKEKEKEIEKKRGKR